MVSLAIAEVGSFLVAQPGVEDGRDGKGHVREDDRMTSFHRAGNSAMGRKEKKSQMTEVGSVAEKGREAK